ncbi:hypothetical protein ABZ901_21725 [Actinacidiphila alni]|uniref:hypothetical protein n=1 Tax=Actinacidiphila alni TaxID=380248 RepID=UPI0033F84185
MTYEPQSGAAGGKHRRPCGFCRIHPADLRDRETGLVWCLGCASDLIHAGDPITDYEEFDAGDRYGDLLARHGSGLYTAFRRRGGPGRPYPGQA